MKWSWCSGCLCCNGAVNGSNQNSSRIQDASVETKRAKNFWNETGGPNRLWDIPNIQECQYEMTIFRQIFQNTTVLSLSKPAERSRGQKPTSLPCFLKSIGSSWLPPSSTSWFWTVLIHICFLENGGHVDIVAQHLQGRSRWSRGHVIILPTKKMHHFGRAKHAKFSYTYPLFWSPNKCIIESHQKMKNSSRGCFFSPPLLG